MTEAATEDYPDLADLLGNEPFNHKDCFDSSRYRDWERNIAEPLLSEKGYEVLRWWSSDEDSFGPLVRCVEVRKDGKSETYFYG